MTVVFVIHTPKDPRTAVFTHVCERARYLQEHGVDVTVIGPEDFAVLRDAGTRPRMLLLPVLVALWLLRRRSQVDIVVFHSYVGWVFHLLTPMRRRPKVVTQFHGLEPLYHARALAEAASRGQPLSLRYRLFHGAVMRSILRLSCHRSNLILCLNRAELRYLTENYWSDTERTRLVANCVSDEFFVGRTSPLRGGRLLFVGQWLGTKGVDELVKAFESTATRRPTVSLTCVGTRAPVDQVLAAFPGPLRGRVQVVPQVDHDAIVSYFRANDLFVLPSKTEGFSVALLEAMAAGLAIVTTPVGAAPDLLQHGVSALLVPPGDAKALAMAVELLLDDPLLAGSLGSKAQEAARAFNCRRVLEEFAALLLEPVPAAQR